MARIKLPKKKDYNTLRNWLLENKSFSVDELSRLSGITMSKIREWMVHCDVIDINDDKMLNIWVNYKHYSFAESCVILGVTAPAFNKALKRGGINKFSNKNINNNTNKTMSLPRNKEDFQKLFNKYGVAKIAKMCGLSRYVVVRMKRKYDLESPRQDKYKSKNTYYNNKKWLKEHYVDKKLSMNKCAKIAGVSSVTIRNWLISHGIVPRPPRIIKNAILQAGIP